MRFGFTPLYLDEGDVLAAVDILQDIVENRLWDRPEYKTVKRVT
jgi:kynureninase